jgi:hypothetical protein
MTSVRKSNGKTCEKMVISVLSLGKSGNGLIVGSVREEMELWIPELCTY